jgi:dihydroorotase
MWEARKRGVLFDLGHGNGSFVWPNAVAAMKGDFPPDTISTDLHQASMLSSKSDMPNCISKMMLLGMPLNEAIYRSTQRPAEVIKKYPEIGTLSEGKVADIAVFELQTGVFAFADAWRKKMMGNQRLRAVLTVRNGEVVFDRDGLEFPEWQKAGQYDVIE